MKAGRRRVRWFVAVHLSALTAIYGAAYAIGGGWAQGLPPDLRISRAPTVPPPAATAAPTVVTVAGGELPAWAQRSELPAPWDGR